MSQMKQPLERLYKQKKLIVESSIPDVPFSPEEQIGENAIDLRLHPQVKRLNESVTEIDFLNISSLDRSSFDEDVLTSSGYVLNPGQSLFCQTLEMINVTSPHHIGIVVGRTKISAYGISVNFNQVKVPAGLLWNFPLHIKNNTEKPIRIYPFICIAQLMIFPYAYGRNYKKEGDYRKINFLSHLGISQLERDRIQSTLEKWESVQSPYPFQVQREAIVKTIERNEKRFWRLRRTFLNSSFFYDLSKGIFLAIVPGAYLHTTFNVPLAFVIPLGLVVVILFILSYKGK